MVDVSPSTSNRESFPAGLKVLVVDDDPLTLKVVGHMLKRCQYEVTTCSNGNVALETLRDRSHQFDLVLSDVYMPDMDGFKLLEHIGLELDLPVIMMSSNGDTSVVLRGVSHGAVDFLIKPVRIEELRNLWQHVVRRRRDLARGEDSKGSGDEDAEDASRRRSIEKKRKERGSEEDMNAAKKPRVVWSVEMHQQFVNAVNQLGIDKAVPKRILDLMNVEGLTRENVASHLQKYRLYLKRVSGVQVGGGRKGHKGADMFPGLFVPPNIAMGNFPAGMNPMQQGMMVDPNNRQLMEMQLQGMHMQGLGLMANSGPPSMGPAMGMGMAVGGMNPMGMGPPGVVGNPLAMDAMQQQTANMQRLQQMAAQRAAAQQAQQQQPPPGFSGQGHPMGGITSPIDGGFLEMGGMQLGMSRGDPASSSGGMTPADVQGFQEILASQRQASQMQMQQQARQMQQQQQVQQMHQAQQMQQAQQMHQARQMAQAQAQQQQQQQQMTQQQQQQQSQQQAVSSLSQDDLPLDFKDVTKTTSMDDIFTYFLKQE